MAKKKSSAVDRSVLQSERDINIYHGLEGLEDKLYTRDEVRAIAQEVVNETLDRVSKGKPNLIPTSNKVTGEFDLRVGNFKIYFNFEDQNGYLTQNQVSKKRSHIQKVEHVLDGPHFNFDLEEIPAITEWLGNYSDRLTLYTPFLSNYGNTISLKLQSKGASPHLYINSERICGLNGDERIEMISILDSIHKKYN